MNRQNYFFNTVYSSFNNKAFFTKEEWLSCFAIYRKSSYLQYIVV
jgi:hypothetical protein